MSGSLTRRLRKYLHKRRTDLVESYSRGLERDIYMKTVGRVVEIDAIDNEISNILKGEPPDDEPEPAPDA